MLICSRLKTVLVCVICAWATIASGESTDEVPAQNAAATNGAESDPRRDARELASSDRSSFDTQKLLIERPDRSRPEHPISIPVFGRPLTFGARYSVLTRFEGSKLLDFDYLDLDNRDIDNDGDEDEVEDRARGLTSRDDQLRVEQEVEIDFFYPFTDNVSAFAEFKLSWRNFVWAEHSETSDEWILDRGELWLYLGRLFDSPFGLQVGRQLFFDEREWWWDEELDSVRLRFDSDRFHAEIAVAEELLPSELIGNENGFDPEERDILQVLALARGRWADDHEVGFYALHHYDHSSRQPLTVQEPNDPDLPCVPVDEIPPNLPPEAKEFFRSGCADPIPTFSLEDDSDAQLTWFGLSAAGHLEASGLGRFEYWLDAAGLVGKERYTDYSGPTGRRSVQAVDKHRVSGFGVDFGGTWQFDAPGRPYVAVGYAVGTGDSNMDETTDSGFRQTGIQGNSDKLHGVVSFDYYGELIDPELSNLEIVTVGLGVGFLQDSSIDFMYHRYRQVEPAPFLHDVEFKRDPLGVSRDIGQEWDVIVGIEDWQPVEFKLVGSIFRPGKAFRPDTSKLSYLLALRVRVNF